MKKIYLPLLFASYISYAQSGNVGINTNTPAATLDVVGQPAVAAKLDGIIAPRLTGQQLYAKNYTATQTGALIYATAADTNLKGQTINVTKPGYYVFDGSVWQSVSTSGNYQEPWNVQGTNTPASANTQNIYQAANVSIGANALNAKLSVYDFSGTVNTHVFYGTTKNSNLGITPWFDFLENLSGGSYSNMTNDNDMGIVFSTDNNENKYSDNGFIVVPHSGGGGATTLGYKFTEQGMFGINLKHPSETLDVAGTMRLRSLPINGATNAIYTNTNGANSLGEATTSIPAPTQTFTATRSVVADNNGVLGYVNGLPGAIYQTDGTLAGNRTVNYNGNNLTFQGNNSTMTTFSGGTTMMLTGMIYNYRELISGTYNSLQVNDYSLFMGKESTGNVTFILPNNGTPTGRQICFSNAVQPDAASQYTLTVRSGSQFPKDYVMQPGEGKCFQYVGQDRWLSF